MKLEFTLLWPKAVTTKNNQNWEEEPRACLASVGR